MGPLDRRRFLGLTAGAGVLAVTGLAGCSGGSSSDLVPVPNDWAFFSGAPYRLSVLIADNAKSGAPVQLNAPVTLRVGPVGQPLGGPLTTVLHSDGPAPPYALTSYTFTHPGDWNVEVTYKGHRVATPITVTDPKDSAVPVVGQPLIRTPTPTPAATLGVNPICTAQPACPFHQVSLDAALAAGHPIALLFATPALCQSRFCGPVLMNLQAVAAPWSNRVTFIHSEIYNNLQGQTDAANGNLAPPVVAYHLTNEPMLLLAGADGIIKVRIDNLFDKGEVRDALTAAFGPAS